MINLSVRISLLLILTAFSILFVVGLYAISMTSQKDEYSGGFTRKYPQGLSLRLVKSIDLPFNHHYLAGLSKDTIYVGTLEKPADIIAISIASEQLSQRSILLENISGITYQIDHPHAFVKDISNHKILLCHLDSLMTPVSILEGVSFSDVIPLSLNEFTVRMLNDQMEFTLARVSKQQPIVYAPVLERQIDGKFCTDGMLRYNKKSGRHVYVYYYRNEFICLNVELDLMYKAHTLDTVSKARIAVAQLASTGELTLASPPRIVNKQCYVSEDHIYIHSLIRADNEATHEFNHRSFVDVYGLGNGDYAFSFSIPAYNGKTLKDFAILEGSLIVLYPQHLCYYRFDYDMH
ncbi:MAG: hypothetical protein KF846_08495 [Cyclobacteriaceae bacterium]|nr:hypothetical protein [Cyclobacteriaceae bacterium]